MSTRWSIFIIVVSLANILGCLWLLWWTSKKNPNEKAEDTTGHVWDDDLRELNNPLPRWWLMLFYLTVFFALVYLALYPGLGNYAGTLNWTQEHEYAEESARIDARQQEVFAKFSGMNIFALAASEEARGIGSRLYANNCAICHGSDGRGAPGFPNLADEDWLYGGEPEQIIASIRDGRAGMMPPMAAALGEQGVAEVAAYVYQLNGRRGHPGTETLLREGERKFGMFCAACHGQDGKGNIQLGAPNLTDDIWLHGGGGIDMIRKAINEGRRGNMPAHAALLNEDEIRLVAGYLQSLQPRGTR